MNRWKLLKSLLCAIMVMQKFECSFKLMFNCQCSYCMYLYSHASVYHFSIIVCLFVHKWNKYIDRSCRVFMQCSVFATTFVLLISVHSIFVSRTTRKIFGTFLPTPLRMESELREREQRLKFRRLTHMNRDN